MGKSWTFGGEFNPMWNYWQSLVREQPAIDRSILDSMCKYALVESALAKYVANCKNNKV